MFFLYNQIAQLSMARDFLCATTHDNSVIVVGGYSGESIPTDIVEKYDERRRQWRRMAAMVKPSSGGILFVCTFNFETEGSKNMNFNHFIPSH